MTRGELRMQAELEALLCQKTKLEGALRMALSIYENAKDEEIMVEAAQSVKMVGKELDSLAKELRAL